MTDKKMLESADVRTRAKQNRFIRAEALRESIDGKILLNTINKIDKELEQIDEDLKKAVEVAYVKIKDPSSKRAKTFKVNPLSSTIRRSRARADVLGKRLDIHFKKLNKILPDVKEQDINIQSKRFTGLDSLSDEMLLRISLGKASNDELMEAARAIGMVEGGEV